jgi:plasmid stabilization system protein ParE
MGKSEIEWTDEARHWLRLIREYIAKDSIEAADRVIEGIWQKTQILAINPEAGFKYPIRERNDIRVLLYGHYRIAYVLHDRTVTILGVFHAALDIDRYFPNTPK